MSSPTNVYNVQQHVDFSTGRNEQQKEEAEQILSPKSKIFKHELSLIELSKSGDLPGVQKIIDQYLGKDTDASTAHDVLNHAHVWTEIQRDWGAEHSFNWYEDTPLIASVRAGHVSVALALLRTGMVDPTLESCHEIDRYGNALNVAQAKLKAARVDIEEVLYSSSDSPLSDDNRFKIREGMAKKKMEHVARHLAAHATKAISTYEMLEVALKAALELWPTATYHSPLASGNRHYLKNRMKCPQNFSLDGTNKDELLVKELNKRIDSALEKLKRDTKENKARLTAHHGSALIDAIVNANATSTNEKEQGQMDKLSHYHSKRVYKDMCICGKNSASKDCVDHLCATCCNHDPTCLKHRSIEDH